MIYFQVIGACSAYLRRQLDMINCVDVITLAETYALPRLRRFAYNYISENFQDHDYSFGPVIVRRLTFQDFFFP